MSVRLDDRTERAVRRLAKRSGRTKSDVIRTAIETLERQNEASSTEPRTAYDRVSHLIGGVGSGGKARVSQRTGSQFRTLVEAKHRALHRVFTLDRRHFGVYRPAGLKRFAFLPH